MEASMQAVVKYQKGDGYVELREVPVPKPSSDEVLIEVKAVSVCGSDLHIYHDEHPYWPPVILGHEFSGILAEIGSDVAGWNTGDRVVSETRTEVCGVCRYCQTGIPQVCPHKRPPGIGIDGAYAKYVVMPAKLLHRMPDGLSFDEAAAMEPTAICVHGVLERTGIAPGDTVLILGPGPIGLISTQLARIAGASKVIVAGTTRSANLKLTKAREVGATHTVNIGTQDIRSIVTEWTDGYGADVVIEASGANQAIEDAFHTVRRHGKICALGINGNPATEVPWDVGIFKAATVTFCFSSSWQSWETSLALIASGKLNLNTLITHREPLSRWQEVYEELEAGHGIKAILHP